jgi:prolyl-tRNA editing enzyme YbaK/EbsC (Cys-tRNA(Pro) deacylase)
VACPALATWSSSAARSPCSTGSRSICREVSGTGFVAGGISQVGQKRRLPIVLDASALALAAMFCCAGRRGLQMEIAPADLIEATGAKVADIAAA